ncbi:sulfatase [Gayadomonas joobiniege]|uniref:sulfatase n=1 Tax=Gayadomonas joobiniege TaxID=1234606 RepID=UPI00036552AF|nr:sulfatase [Gayadomonas joobiniege]
MRYLVNLLIACCLMCITHAQANQKPNIVMLVVDDLGWRDLGYNQSNANIFETPNIDKLAQQSALFTQAYAGAANCAPSRAVLMSGQYGPRHGIYTVSPSDRGSKYARRIKATKNLNTLPDAVITLAETLKTADYTTGSFGKWHLGEDAKTQGFDVNVAGYQKGHPSSYFSPYNLKHLIDGPDGEYLTDRITSEAINWIKAQKEQPFFAYIPYYTVHTPLQAEPDMLAKYLNKKGIINKQQATYAAMVELMDKNVGRILTALKTLGLADNTLFIFTSDNGGIRSISAQDPLRAGKGSYYEGGIRVPLLMFWPGKIAPQQIDEPVINADFYPTLVSLTRAEKPSQVLDGIDLMPRLLNQHPLPERALFWHFPIYLQAYNPAADQGQDPMFRTRPGSAMRFGDWKLIHYFETNEYELYNLHTDLSEHVNLATILPDKLAHMKNMLRQWQIQVGAPIPSDKNPDFDLNKAKEWINQQFYKKN